MLQKHHVLIVGNAYSTSYISRKSLSPVMCYLNKQCPKKVGYVAVCAICDESMRKSHFHRLTSTQTNIIRLIGEFLGNIDQYF